MSENKPIELQVENGIGTVTFANDVIAIIAGLAATEVDGVASMSGNNVVSGIAEALGRRNLTKGVKVVVGQVEAAIDIYCIVDYGFKIQEVASKVQQSVKKTVETMTGLTVVECNVHIDALRFEKEKEAAAAVSPQLPEPDPRVH
jgi:uncharacterized alkaline shock family protein YloU